MKRESVLRQYRTRQQRTLKEVADAVGLSVAGYQQIETGRNAVSLAIAERIAEYFGEPVEGFFTPTYFTVTKGSAG